MDEADILGDRCFCARARVRQPLTVFLFCDRIAIMAEGQLKCSGSSHFLKEKFGVGYILTLVKSAEADSHHLPIADKMRVQALTKVIVEYVPGSKLVSNVGSEVHYEMPFSACEHLPALLLVPKGLLSVDAVVLAPDGTDSSQVLKILRVVELV